MAKPTHEGPHKYFQTKFKESGTTIYRCGLQNCPHFVYEPLILHRVSICWRCGANFEITKRSLRSLKMHCENCTRFKKDVIPPAVDADVDKILFDIAAREAKEAEEKKGKENDQSNN